MGLLTFLFGSKKSNFDDKPPIYGGDGLSDSSPAIINCASMDMAQHLMDQFMAEKCGTGWERGIEFTLGDPNNPKNNLKAITVKLSNGEITHFYFDLSRPVANAMKMLGLK